MIKQLILFAACLLLATGAQSQIVSRINFDEIKSAISKPGATNYETLLKRAAALDTTLVLNDFKLLYFGQVFSANYKPYGSNLALAPAQKLISEGKLDEAMVLTDANLKTNPISIDALFLKLTLLYQQKNMANTRPVLKLMTGLIAAIVTSGDGKSDKTAMVVTSISDEYKVMLTLGLQPERQELVKDGKYPCDKMILKPNRHQLSELYFNISQPMESLMKDLKP